jgi:hypothetical protein
MASDDQLANDLQKVEDTAIEKLNKEFKESVRQTITDTDWSKIEQRLASMQDPGDVADAVTWQGYDPMAVLEGEVFPAASEIMAEYVADVVSKGSSLSFTVTDPNAIKWLKDYGAEEIKYIGQSQRDAIKKIVTDGYRDGITYQQQARQIRDSIGLDPRRAEVLRKYSDNLFSKGKSEEEVWRLMGRKGAALLNARAKTIAVQEALTAGARGFYETTADAVRRGILDPNIYEAYRIVTGDERTCPKCGGLIGESRRLPDGVYQSSGDVTPKLHMKCRCVEGIREITMKKKEMKESGRGRANVIFEAKSLKRKDGIIFCPTVPLVEGVYDGWGIPVLRQYEEFSKDAKWLNGLTVLTNHEALTPDARRVGQLSEITPKPEGKKVAATTQFYELDLTQREIESIMSREPIHGSLGFSCYLDMTAGDYNGTHYEAIERGPYVFYEYSMVRQGVVTPEDGAGFNIEGRNHDHQSQSSAPGGADMDKEEMKQVIEEAQKPLMDRLAALEQSNTTLRGELKSMKEQAETDEQARVFEAFTAKLKPGHQEKARELFEASQKDPLWITENADKFVQAGPVRQLTGRSSTEGGAAPGKDRPYTAVEMTQKQAEMGRTVI